MIISNTNNRDNFNSYEIVYKQLLFLLLIYTKRLYIAPLF
jgi:hypothetical protein